MTEEEIKNPDPVRHLLGQPRPSGEPSEPGEPGEPSDPGQPGEPTPVFDELDRWRTTRQSAAKGGPRQPG